MTHPTPDIEIKRYDHVIKHPAGGGAVGFMQENDEGGYVDYDDHARALQAERQAPKWQPSMQEGQEITPELQAAATEGKQILAYENGCYYNAWLEFDAWDGWWVWVDESDSEPHPQFWMPLPAPPSESRP